MTEVIYRPNRENPPRNGDRFLDAVLPENILNKSADNSSARRNIVMVRFTSGVNRIPDVQWQSISTSNIGKQLIEWKALEEIEPKEIVVAPSTPDLSKLSIEGAEKVIENTSDLVLLQQWAEQDARKTVKNAANLRMKAIKEGRV